MWLIDYVTIPVPSGKDITDNEELDINKIIKISKQHSVYLENTSIKRIYNGKMILTYIFTY